MFTRNVEIQARFIRCCHIFYDSSLSWALSTWKVRGSLHQYPSFGSIDSIEDYDAWLLISLKLSAAQCSEQIPKYPITISLTSEDLLSLPKYQIIGTVKSRTPFNPGIGQKLHSTRPIMLHYWIWRRKFNFRWRGPPDSSVSSRILVGWCEEGHPTTKNLLQLSQG